MTAQDVKTAGATAILLKADPTAPALIVTGPNLISVKAGTSFAGLTLHRDAEIPLPASGLVVGADYHAVKIGEGWFAHHGPPHGAAGRR